LRARRLGAPLHEVVARTKEACPTLNFHGRRFCSAVPGSACRTQVGPYRWRDRRARVLWASDRVSNGNWLSDTMGGEL